MLGRLSGSPLAQAALTFSTLTARRPHLIQCELGRAAADAGTTTQRGGLHLLFKAAPGPRCSAGGCGAGVDVRAAAVTLSGGRERAGDGRRALSRVAGLLYEGGDGAEAACFQLSSQGHPVRFYIDDVGSLAKALGKLKPEQWQTMTRNSEGLHWNGLQLMQGKQVCRHRA